MLEGDVYSTPPQAVNAAGVKFWLDRHSTLYAHNKGLMNVQVLYVEELDGKRTRLIAEDGQPIHTDTSMDGIGVYLDVMALSND